MASDLWKFKMPTTNRAVYWHTLMLVILPVSSLLSTADYCFFFFRLNKKQTKRTMDSYEIILLSSNHIISLDKNEAGLFITPTSELMHPPPTFAICPSQDSGRLHAESNIPKSIHKIKQNGFRKTWKWVVYIFNVCSLAPPPCTLPTFNTC